jgi:PAS domain S-box-containing protein
LREAAIIPAGLERPENMRQQPVSNFSKRTGESQFQRLLDTFPAATYTCDARGRITYFNVVAVNLWGRAPKLHEPADRFYESFRLFAEDGTPIRHDQCGMALTLQNGKVCSGQEIIIERPDGQRLTALAHANPLFDESGTVIGAVNVLVDITGRAHAENAQRESNNAQNEFLATLAHELRNPLAPIVNALAILQLRSEPAPDVRWAVEVIDRQMRQMTRLIDDLLDVARITRNRLELHRERVELSVVLRTAIETSRPLIEASGHQFAVTAPTEIIYLDADLTRLAQVISNLLDNAAKYTERGGRIWLRSERQGSDIVVCVRDTGIGIPREMQPHIFEMFTHVDRAVDRSKGGLGIGLTLVRRLVEMHGGSIAVQSDGPGAGSAFTVRLPAVVEPAVAQPEIPRSADGRLAHSSLRILVVDDNRDAAASLGMLLRIMGIETRTAVDGVDAMTVASGFRPNVILLDIGLPKLSGYEVAKRIRRERWAQEIALVAVTGWGQEADRDRSKSAGFDHHLVKPVDPAALIQLLDAVEQAIAARERQACD